MNTSSHDELEKVIALLNLLVEARETATVRQVIALLHVIQHLDSPQSDIAKKLGDPQGVVSKWISKWADSGYLQKHFVPGSELRKEYSLTKKGLDLANRMRAILAP